MVAPDVVKRAIAAKAVADWVSDEMKGADLNDRRHNRRLNRILSDLADRPTASIPAACGGKTETVAADRFVDNDQVDPQAILVPHYRKTREWIAAVPTAILVPDSTEWDLTRPEQQVEGAGPLDDEPRRGVLAHLLAAITEDGTPLGAVWSRMWTRAEPEPAAPPRDHQRIPIEEKESYRWLEGLRRARALAEEVPGTRCIVVADSESDIYEVLAEYRGAINPVDWVIRACFDRGLAVGDEEEAASSCGRARRPRRCCSRTRSPCGPIGPRPPASSGGGAAGGWRGRRRWRCGRSGWSCGRRAARTAASPRWRRTSCRSSRRILRRGRTRSSGSW